MVSKNLDNDPRDPYQPAEFEQVLDRELEYFEDKKRLKRESVRAGQVKANKDECGTAYAKNIVAEANKAQLAGLAFSGGGIRSATFNLGVLQALARLKLLKEFDYLSTVSGGGYIGSWLAAWMCRTDADLKEEESKSRSGENDDRDRKESTGLEVVSRELESSVSAREDEAPRGAMQPDPPPIWHLREYSNYLSPRRGFWSTDAWTLGVTYIRNLVLIFSLLLATLITLALGTRAIASLYFRAAHGQYDIAYVLVPVLFYLFLFFTALLVGIELSGSTHDQRKSPLISNLAVFAAWLSAATGALWLWHTITVPQGVFTAMLVFLIPGSFSLALLDLFPGNVAVALTMLPVAIFSLLGWFAGLFIGRLMGRRKTETTAGSSGNDHAGLKRLSAIVFSSLLSTALFIGVFLLLASWIKDWLPTDIERWDPLLWHVTVVGTPLLVLIFSIVAVVFVGIAGGALSELDREWLGRFFAALSKWSALSTFLIVLVVYSPCLVEWLGSDILGPTAAWGTLSATGVFLARNAMSEQSAVQGWLKKAILAITPFVFILGMLILTVWVTDQGVQWVVKKFKLVADVNGDPPGFWYLMLKVDVLTLLNMFAVTAVFMGFWSWRVGVNRFSLHSLYADRLIRAYLGASNLKRNAHPFTGFDDSDNEVHMPDLGKKGSRYSGPYLIVNAAINLVSGNQLAWQKRKAASFTLTPQFCGYEFCGEANGSGENGGNSGRRTGRIGGFVESDQYAGELGRGISLGRAMTISGAAASPNMGYHSSPALTFLMTTFNVRLGWWLPNTANKNLSCLRKREPGWGLLYLLTELFGLTSARSNYVYLSDGGHFENLGIYELVRRRCRIIVACDAEADPKMTVSGLGNAIEKCQTDFGVPIEIDVSQIRPDPETGHSQWHCAVGCIRYSEADMGQADGTLVYIKASLTGDEPQSVAAYASDRDGFPHETTADQWFDETQFESYRMLGEHIAEVVLRNARSVADSMQRADKKGPRIIERVILEARKQWYPDASARTSRPADHDALLESIMDTLRNDTRLTFLDEQLYPNLRKVAEAYSHGAQEHSIPWNYREFRTGFYFCKRLIQFMQQVYYDRQLDTACSAPRNRGWMNLFRRWSWSRMLRFTWTMTAGTYGARFQSFCEHRLGLESGEPGFSEKPLEIRATPSPEPDQHKVIFEPPPEYCDAEPYDWEGEAKQLGLHYYEIRLIREFLRAYVYHEDLKCHSQPFPFQVFPLEVVTDDPVADDVDKDLKLNAGFLIAGPRLKQADSRTPDYETAILYFRIRPSMRNMDLARKAFLECRKHPILKGYSPRLVDDLPECGEESKAAWQRRAFHDVHNMERESLDHCRWFSQLLEEVAVGEDKQEDQEVKE